MANMKIQDLLKGYIVDRDNIQSVGNMTVIPIVSDIEFTNVADVNDVHLKKDREYNVLEFENSSGNIGIAMQGWALIDGKQQAQDRTIPYAHLIKAGKTKLIPANCIQARQPGHFDPNHTDHNSFMILPPSLRGIAIKNNASYSSSNYNALWESLATWTKGVDCYQGGLTNFYSQFEDKLDQFVAQFEPVDKQLGAIVIINGEIVAMDIMPKYKNWNDSWRAIIRDSYGAESVRATQNSGSAVNIHPGLDLTSINNIDDLAKAYENMKNDFYDVLQDVVSRTVDIQLNYDLLEQAGELSMLKFDSSEFVGQGVMHGDNHFVYLSLIVSSSRATGKRSSPFQSLRRTPYGSSGFSFA